MPLGSIFVFFVVAVPVIVLMTVWAGVMAFRLLFPEDALPFEPSARRRRATAGGQSVPVRLHDIVEDQQARYAVAARERAARGPETPATNPLFDDLWLRRN